MVIAELSTPLMNLCTLLRPASKHKGPVHPARGLFFPFASSPLRLYFLHLPLLLRQPADTKGTAIPLLLNFLHLPV